MTDAPGLGSGAQPAFETTAGRNVVICCDGTAFPGPFSWFVGHHLNNRMAVGAEKLSIHGFQPERKVCPARDGY